MIHEFRSGEKILKIFMNFEVDHSLPKYKKHDDIAIGNLPTVFTDGDGQFSITTNWNTVGPLVGEGSVLTTDQPEKKKSHHILFTLCLMT